MDSVEDWREGGRKGQGWANQSHSKCGSANNCNVLLAITLQSCSSAKP